MNRTRLLQGFGAFSLVGGSVAIWYAFQRQICTNVAGGGDSCAPNIVYLIPGTLAALIGFSLVVYAYRRQNNPTKEGTR
jgi:lipid-A-disaccharide synthase-like uncharacterized protein